MDPKRRSPAPPSSGVPASAALTPPPRLVIPELRALQELRALLARASTLPHTPEDSARVVAFHAIAALLRILDRFRKRVESGERCRLVREEREGGADRVVIELAIVRVDEGRDDEATRSA